MSNHIKTKDLNWISGKVPGFQGKDLLNEHNGTLKVVKVDSGAEYPIHIHPDKLEFAYVLSGNASFLIDGKEYDSEEHDFFIFPTGVKHAILNKTNKVCELLVGAILS